MRASKVVREIRDYTPGGAKDPRIRAVQGVAKIEEVLAVIEEGLLPTKHGGRLKRIGRLVLRWERGQQHFRWRRRMGAREWEDIGRRVPNEIKWKLRPGTRAKVEGVERWLDIREVGILALRLVDLCVVDGIGWKEKTVQVRWKRSDFPRGVTWSFFLSGGWLRKGGALAEGGPPVQYQSDVTQLMDGRGGMGGGGPVTVGTERMVGKIGQMTARLHQLKSELHGAVRIYYDYTRDTFQIRQVMGKGWSTYHGKTVDATLMRLLSDAERARVAEAVDVLDERGRTKRALQIIATIAEVMTRWPGGVWQMKGRSGAKLPASWVTEITEHGVLKKRYGVTKQIAVGGAESDEKEW